MKPAWTCLCACLSAACASLASPDAGGDPAGSTQDPALAAVCRDAWEHALRFDPLFATRLGDARYHGALVSPGPATEAARAAEVDALLARVRTIDAAALSRADRITWEVLLADLEQTGRELAAELSPSTYNLDPLEGPQALFLSLAEDQPAATAREREQCLERWRRIPGYLDAVRGNLEQGLAEGRVASWTAAHKVLAQLDQLLATPPEESALSQVGGPDAPAGFRRELVAIVAGEIYPAYARLRRTISERILPHVRDDRHPGLAHVPGGRELYALLVLRETSLELEPEAVHAIGLAEVARIQGEIAELGERAFGTRDLAEIQRRLRQDPALHFTTREEVEAQARRSLERANAAVPAVFGRLPAGACTVVRVPEHEERDTTIAYYRAPSGDGRLPGRYFINTYDPTSRPRYDAEVLAYHEAVPGHHLQIALAQELEGLPHLRRHRGSTAFVEGWALYSERLCQELGLYSGDLDRLGLLSFDAWRAARLVVDTGLHALGWTRQQAIDYLAANTLLALNNVENEVDRYIAWPAQALAYKLGQREILALRGAAEQALGERFELAAFHDRLLENGAVPLGVLRSILEEWIEAEQERAAEVAGPRP
jgi:uncharacterized protein (DUF885 family)